MSGSFTRSYPAPAKINLYLRVTGQRADGYHLLDSLFAFAGIHDVIDVSESEDLTLNIDGPFANEISNNQNNLVLRAATGLARIAGRQPCGAIRLSKRLPVASGMGGGSSDAAATIRALSELWDIQLSKKDLQTLALELGADVPACLTGKAAFISGIGEIIEMAPPIPAASLVLVNPGIAVSTPDVFRNRQGPFSDTTPFSHTPKDAHELASLLSQYGNDLRSPAEKLAPVITEVLHAMTRLDGALFTEMTGSGATCFALFDDPATASRAAISLRQKRPDWWIEATSLESDITNMPANENS